MKLKLGSDDLSSVRVGVREGMFPEQRQELERRETSLRMRAGGKKGLHSCEEWQKKPESLENKGWGGRCSGEVGGTVVSSVKGLEP